MGGAVANDIPYMMQMGNIPRIFARIREAGTPPKFTHEFLKNSLGFTGSGDRGIIKVLKALGFLSNDSVPTERYNRFKGPAGNSELAQGLREGWAPIFLADQAAQDRTHTQLTQIFKSVTGAGDASAKKMAGTFKAIAEIADWQAPPDVSQHVAEVVSDAESTAPQNGDSPASPDSPSLPGLTLRHDIHLHLPATSDVTVYTAIFRAIRDELRD
jgi:hypothetical protein